VERLNRTLVNGLRMAVAANQKDWPDWVDRVLFAYRASRHESTGTSPFQALYGVAPRLPVDLQYGTQLDSVHGSKELMERMAHTRRSMREEMRRAEKRRTAEYNSRHKVKPPAVNKGDRIYLRHHQIGPGLSKKLSPGWIGPFEVVDQEGEVNWVIQGKDGKKKTVHANQMKPCHDQVSELGILRGRGRPRKGS